MVDPNPLPNLQFAVLGVLGGEERSGRVVRDALEELGIRKGGPAFYRLMARMEEGGLIEGRYEQEVVDSQIYRERVYRATADGVAARDRSKQFQLAVIRRFAPATGEALA